jgi:hypothetical protein
MTTRSPEWPSIQTLADICANKNRHRILGRAARRGRKPTTGAIQILEQENIIRTSTRGAGSEVIYHFQVLDRLPVLTPAQVAILTPRLHDRHRLAIARCKLNLNEWHQLTLATLIEDTG